MFCFIVFRWAVTCGGFINRVGWICCYCTVACLLLFSYCEIFVNLMLLCVRIIMVVCFGLVFGLVYWLLWL